MGDTTMTHLEMVTWAKEQAVKAFNANPERNVLQEMYMEMAWEITSLNNDLEEWGKKFQAEPAYSFEWSDQAMDNAARIELYCQILSAMFDAEKKGENPADCLGAWIDETTKKLIQFYDYDASHTGGAKSLMMGKKGYAASRLLEKAGYWLRKLNESN